ncbi:hypothetical protein G9C98_007066 [Cotesia typhae]|uniref:Gustatory receptor n=1 Tax=Cotesia typhae TaxID=2053667 RepID=A0A8J5UTP4_9HYME|nr:hypothetical protein G9C98_007066 [Cotesia typhae]
MWKEAIICIVGTFCFLQIVDSHPAIVSTSFDVKNETQDIKYTVWSENHDESKFYFKPSRMADNSSMSSVELRIESFTPNQTETSSEILAQKESFLFVVEPSHSEFAREVLRLMKLVFNFCISYGFLFLSTIMMVDFFIFYCLINLYLLYTWKSINKNSQNLKESHKEKRKLILRWLLVTAISILTQTDKIFQDIQQEEQHILIIRYWNSSYSIFDNDFGNKLMVYLLLSGEYVLVKIFIVWPILIVMAIISMIYCITLVVKTTYMLLDHVYDLKKELDSKVIVTPCINSRI